ncbi:MAG: hypothetical protein K6F54_04550 [Lachnospiraceae bacterium]|nr:hypothetical protein [Lachnospiraceae bacterium]
MAPPKMNFNSGFLPDTANLDENKLDDSLRSFMDKGESVFENEEGRANVIEGVRNTLLARMRDENAESEKEADQMEQNHIRYSTETMLPIIAKAKSAKRSADIAYAEFLVAKSRLGNDAADEAISEIDAIVDAARTEKEALTFKHLNIDLNPQLSAGVLVMEDNGDAESNADEGMRNAGAPQPEAEEPEEDSLSGRFDRTEDYYRLAGLQMLVHENRNNPMGSIMRALTLSSLRMRRARSKADSARTAAIDAKQEILDCSERWSEIRNRYREDTFRKRYRQYDKLAGSYYRFTRSLEGSEQRNIDQVGSELGGGSAAKNIAEYTGVYDNSQIINITNNISSNPYSPEPELKRVKNKALGAESQNTESADRPLKYHRAIVMQAFAEGIKTVSDEAEQKTTRIRMKLLNNFRGYRARNQYDETALTDSGLTAQERGKNLNNGPEGLTAASEMNLVADERGRNGDFIMSENSARIYDARTKTFGGETVRGFFFNGQFISDNYTAMQNQSQSSFLRSPNWNDVAEEEQVRMAIRRSDFFYHVNSGTIQHYITYRSEDSYSRDNARDQIEKADKEAQADTLFSLKLLDAYLDPASDAATELNAGHDAATLTRLSGAAVAAAASDKGKVSRQLAVMMLTEDDPELWNIAKEMAGQMGGRFEARLKGIPQSGEVMRMTLLGEMSNDRAFDWTNIMESLRPDRLNMHIEDLNARRDSFFSLTNLRQSFWDGSLLGTASGAFSATTADIKTLGVEGGIKQVCNGFNKNYASIVSSLSTNFGLAAAPVPLIVMAYTGGQTDEGKVSEEADNTISGFRTAQSTLDFIQDIAGIVKQIQKIIKSKKKGDPIWPIAMKLMGLVINLINDVIDIVSYWLDTTAMTVVSGIAGIVKNIFNIAKNIITIVRSTREINKINTSDENIETALTEYKDQAQLRAQIGMEATENNLSTDTAKMGRAATENSQGQYFLSLARSRARRDRKMAISGIVTNTINMIGGIIGMGSKAAWFNPIAFPFKLAGKVSQFIGWCIGKVHDSNELTDNIAQALGDRRLASNAGFDAALRRETGIRNRHYLVDLARIFMAIDTHHLVRSNNKTDGETALAINLMHPYLEMVGNNEDRYENPINKIENDARLKKVKFDRLLEAVGGPANWRSVLRASISS